LFIKYKKNINTYKVLINVITVVTKQPIKIVRILFLVLETLELPLLLIDVGADVGADFGLAFGADVGAEFGMEDADVTSLNVSPVKVL
jgi:hypothetical protein